MATRIRWSLLRRGESSLCRVVIRCLHLAAHTAPDDDTRALSQRVTPGSNEQLALAPAICSTVFPHSFHSSRAAVLDCSLSNKARTQSACRQLLFEKGGRLAGATAASAAQQMQKREKSFGKTLSLRFDLYERRLSCVFAVLWHKLQSQAACPDLTCCSSNPIHYICYSTDNLSLAHSVHKLWCYVSDHNAHMWPRSERLQCVLRACESWQFSVRARVCALNTLLAFTSASLSWQR